MNPTLVIERPQSPSGAVLEKSAEKPMDAFEATRWYFNQAADHLDLTDNMRTLLVTLVLLLLVTPLLAQPVPVVVALDTSRSLKLR